MLTLKLCLLAMITFGTRYLFIHPNLPIRLPPKMQQWLSYSAPAVLTAIWLPIIVIQKQQLALSVSNPYLLGALVAIVIAYWKKSIYLTIFGAGFVFILAKYMS